MTNVIFNSIFFLFYSKRNGKSVSPEENELFISIFKSCGEGTSVEDHFYEDGDSENISVYGRVYQSILMSYVQMVRKLLLKNKYEWSYIEWFHNYRLLYFSKETISVDTHGDRCK